MGLFMENFRLALFSIKANKMRALLTMLGIIIGISAVITIMTIGDSITYTLSDTMSGLGVNNIDVYVDYRGNDHSHDDDLVYISDGEEFESEEEYQEWVKKRTPKETDFMTLDMIKGYAEEFDDQIRAIQCGIGIGNGQAKDGNLYANVDVSGVSMGTFLAQDVKLVAGRFFTERENEKGAKVAIVSNKFVENMFKGDNEAAIGQTVEVYIGDKTYNFVIVGVYEYIEQSLFGMTFSSDKGKDIKTTMYAPLKTGMLLSHNDYIEYITVMTEADVDATKFVKDTDKYFEALYKGNKFFHVTAHDYSGAMQQLNDVMNKLTVGISVIAGIALLVGGIGVMNIMLVSITERTREIGTRKALGAPNSSIRIQFIVESIVICVIGGIIGIILGCAAGMGVAAALNSSVQPSFRAIMISLTFSMAIGVFFGYYPANKAAKMDPIEALRYE